MQSLENYIFYLNMVFAHLLEKNWAFARIREF